MSTVITEGNLQRCTCTQILGTVRNKETAEARHLLDKKASTKHQSILKSPLGLLRTSLRTSTSKSTQGPILSLWAPVPYPRRRTWLQLTPGKVWTWSSPCDVDRHYQHFTLKVARRIKPPYNCLNNDASILILMLAVVGQPF